MLATELALALSPGDAKSVNGSEVCGEELLTILFPNASTQQRTCEQRIVAEYDCCEENCDDLSDGAVVNYMRWSKCSGSSSTVWLRQAAMAFLVLYLIYVLGTTADDFFCPASFARHGGERAGRAGTALAD